MENKIKRHTHTIIPNNNSSSHPLPSLHRDSHTISKPNIRIIHIFAPKIIKTDAENFRELVQKLTGKPSPSEVGGENSKYWKNDKKKNPIIRVTTRREQQQEPTIRSTSSDGEVFENISEGIMDYNNAWGKVKEEVGACCNSDEISSGGYLGGFSDDYLEGFFISELGGDDQFPLFALDNGTHNMQGFEENQI